MQVVEEAEEVEALSCTAGSEVRAWGRRVCGDLGGGGGLSYWVNRIYRLLSSGLGRKEGWGGGGGGRGRRLST